MSVETLMKSLPAVTYLPIDNPKHTEILGSRCSTKNGAALWKMLDWNEWWIDGPAPHMFNPGGFYFHVGTNTGEGEVFRVRCWYAGGKYKGREVDSIGIGMLKGKLHWIVRSKTAEATHA